MVDLSNLNSITVDSSTNTAVIETGNRLGTIALELNNAGRALPHGTCPYVGIGGHSGELTMAYSYQHFALTLLLHWQVMVDLDSRHASGG